MQWSYHLGSTILATTSKFKIAVEIGVFRLIHEALYFCSICNNLDSVHRIQTKFGMDILLDPRNKPAKEFFHFFQNPRWPPAVKNFRRVILFQCFCNNFDPVNRIQTKFVMNILLHPRNNPAEEFFIFFSHFKLPPHQRALWTFVGATNWRVNYLLVCLV